MQQQLRNLIDLEEGLGVLPPTDRVIGGEPGGNYQQQGEGGDDQRQDRADSKIHLTVSFCSGSFA
jgi:hypothetical protein